MKFRRQLTLALLLFLAPAGAPAETSGPGVVVEEAGQGSALERAGLRAGDLVLSWEREGDRGEIRTVFDWSWVKAEQAPRGTVRLHGEREGAGISFEVPKGDWDARVRPRMAADLLQAYTEGRRRIEAGEVEGGVALWTGLSGLEPWILLKAAEAWSNAGQHDKARAVLQAALEEAGDAQVRVALLDALGQSFLAGSDAVRAEASFRSALEIATAAWGESLQGAGLAGGLGLALRRQNRLPEATQVHEAALAVRERLAPDSLDVALGLDQLAQLSWAKGDLDAVYELSRRALAIQERWAPGNLAASEILNHVAISALERGLVEEGKAALRRALAIQERRAPGSLHMALTLGNLGAVTRETGDPDAAEELLLRALQIREKLAPESAGTAVLLYNLGLIARNRGDLDRAEELIRRTMAIWAKAAPQGIGVAAGYNDLGNVARLRGDLDRASELYGRALEMRERLVPGSLDLAESVDDLALVSEMRGDPKQALALLERSAAIYARLAPGAIKEAVTLHRMARLHRREGRADTAAQLLGRALAALESQVGRLGGSRYKQADYRARYEEIYRDAVEVEMERGRDAEAFHLLERSRARSFLALLAERDLSLRELPADLELALRDNAARYDRTLRALSRWAPAAGEEAREALHRDLDRLRGERDGIADRVRAASPRVATLREPQPLDLEGARRALDPGTLALSYSVGKEKTAVFAVTREGGLQVTMLALGEERLRREVESFLERVRSQEEPGADLYRELIAPVAGLVERSERVLIVPDGPLHRLPFGALAREDGRFLIETKPVHTALSLTVYGTLRESPAASGAETLVAFGDPSFPKGMTARGDLEPGLRSFDWSSLPYSRREVEQIAGVHPGASVYLGAEATEERAKSIRGARILHFATHGYTDDRSPLDSALVLTIPEKLAPGRDNGLLQVWEIFESVRLDADLVVLSACESALGREQSGEGLIGLTRAFQYAGARSVVASLWSVADQVTAELMTRFHRHLAAGLPKDEALRAAQIELIREPVRITAAQGREIEMDASAPFFWAAFELFGDWK